MRPENYFVYILTNQRHTALYIGVTNDIARRAWQHGEKSGSGFTRQYNADKLIYIEIFPDPLTAICREKQLKKWRRQKKEALIATKNPEWRNIGPEVVGFLHKAECLQRESPDAARDPSTSLRFGRDDAVVGD